MVIGPQTTAGSSLIFLAKNGKEQPTNLEINMVTNRVEATSNATIAIAAWISPSFNRALLSLMLVVSIIPVDISTMSHPKAKQDTTPAIIKATRISFHITLK